MKSGLVKYSQSEGRGFVPETRSVLKEHTKKKQKGKWQRYLSLLHWNCEKKKKNCSKVAQSQDQELMAE